MSAFQSFARWYLGRSPKFLASKVVPQAYSAIADLHLVHDRFFYDECGMPRTFQSWFRIANLHAWLLVVRFRALPSTHGRLFIQALVTSFFTDVEERMRDALTVTVPGRKNPVPAPERVITKYMKIYREQWNGLHFALDVALASPHHPDAELAAAVWRNFLAGRGARGIDGLAPLPESELPPLEVGKNAVAPEPEADPAIDLDKYVELPRIIFALSRYIRKETVRLQGITDEEILNGNFGKFGPIDSNVDVSKLSA